MNLQTLPLEASYKQCALEIGLIWFLHLWLKKKSRTPTPSIPIIVSLLFSYLKQNYALVGLSPQIDCKSLISRISTLSAPLTAWLT